MSQFLETIKIKDYSIMNIGYHNNRVNETRHQLLNLNENWELEKNIILDNVNPAGIYKCRILYSDNIDSIEYVPYKLPDISNIKMVSSDTIDYSFKYANRIKLDELRKLAQGADDILVIKNGLVSDTSFANIVFFDGRKWFTPKLPLLRGTKRQFYIDQNIIFEKEIKAIDLPFFKKARIINAMIDLEESKDIEIKNIFY
jgi:4-amino-4-deoxychorismate lyase